MASRKAPGKVVALCCQLGGARKGRLSFLGGVALRPHNRLAVGRLKVQTALSKRDGGLDLLRLRQRREHRLRLGDLRHFGRWRKPFERGRERVVRFDRAATRLIELGERERGAQFEAARALRLRNRGGGLEGFFGGEGIGNGRTPAL